MFVGMVQKSASSCTILFCLAVLSSTAQVKEWDYTDRASELESKRFDYKVESPEADSRWMSHRFDTKRYPAQTHRFNEQLFESGRIEMLRTQKYETPELEFAVREVEWYRSRDKQFNNAELRVLRDNSLSQFQSQNSTMIDIERGIDVEEVLDQLSLADLNRFQFRRSHPSEAGIPIDQAGSEGTDPS